jgi:hypothetical protein
VPLPRLDHDLSADHDDEHHASLTGTVAGAVAPLGVLVTAPKRG